MGNTLKQKNVLTISFDRESVMRFEYLPSGLIAATYVCSGGMDLMESPVFNCHGIFKLLSANSMNSIKYSRKFRVEVLGNYNHSYHFSSSESYEVGFSLFYSLIAGTVNWHQLRSTNVVESMQLEIMSRMIFNSADDDHMIVERDTFVSVLSIK